MNAELRAESRRLIVSVIRRHIEFVEAGVDIDGHEQLLKLAGLLRKSQRKDVHFAAALALHYALLNTEMAAKALSRQQIMMAGRKIKDADAFIRVHNEHFGHRENTAHAMNVEPQALHVFRKKFADELAVLGYKEFAAKRGRRGKQAP